MIARSAHTMRTATVIVGACLLVSASVSAQHDQTAFEAWVGMARVKMDAGDAGGAAAAWQEAERRGPLSPALREEMFWAVSRANRPAARTLAGAILKTSPLADKVRERAIALALEEQDEASIVALAHEGFTLDASGRWARALGASALRRGDAREAVKWLRAVMASPDAIPEDAPMLAIALSATGDDRAAGALWETTSPSVWQREAAWSRSRLLAQVKAAWNASTMTDVDEWLRGHPDDHDLRRAAINALQRTGDYARALALSLAGPNDVDALRLRAHIADQARRADIARRARKELAHRADAAVSDRLAAAEWLRANGDEADALTVATSIAARRSGCIDETVALLARMSADGALTTLSGVMRRYPASCPAAQSWQRALVHKLLARQRFVEAAEFAEPLATLSGSARDREVVGQLRLWLGDPAGASAILMPLIAKATATPGGIDAAIDALRAQQRSAEAWPLAEGRLRDPALSRARTIDLSDLAIDAGHAEEAFERLSSVADPAADERAHAVLAKAQAALARQLLDAHDPQRAIAVLTAHARPLSAIARRLLAQAYTEAGRPAAADQQYATLVADDEVTPDLFLTWSQLREGKPRLEILRTGQQRFPTDATLTLLLAIGLHQAGDLAAAAPLARKLVAVDPSEPAAWRIVIDEARVEPTSSAMTILAPVPRTFASAPATLIELANRLGAAGASDAASATALRWLMTMDAPADAELRVTRELARARLLNSRGHAAAALDIVAPLAADAEARPDVLHLHAQLLGWNGHHSASIDAFDRYLALVPDDRDARREQARVAGWGQQFERASRFYAALGANYPSDAAARAEADAKRLFYDSDWRAAAPAYERWLRLEPDNAEAAFEYAETLVAQGRITEAREIYLRLAHSPRPHEMASAAQRVLDERAHPTAALESVYVSATGYEGQRLLDWSATSARLSTPLFGDVRQTLEAEAGSMSFSNRSLRLPAYDARVRTTAVVNQVSLRGAFALVRGARDLSLWSGRGEAAFAVRHNLELRVAADRTPLLENLSTLLDGVSSWGPSVALTFTTPDTEVTMSARTGWVAKNTTTATAALVRHRVRRGPTQLWMIGSVTHDRWEQSDLRFFSPAAFTRVDSGIEWMRWLRVPRFRVDRRGSLTVRHLVGVDSRGEWYQQPQARFSVEHRRVAIDAEASWMTSHVYRSLSLRLGVRVGG